MKSLRSHTINRRDFIRQGAAAFAGSTLLGRALATTGKGKRSRHDKVIVIGVDGMDPRLTTRLMNAGRLPHLNKLRQGGGFRPLRTSTPPQSPVAWANFINGAGPGTHGLFDFIHRHPEKPSRPFYCGAETLPGHGYWDVGNHKLQLTFWPFNHDAPETVLRRQGVPFWDYLDEAGIKSCFYDLPSNYPPSKSGYGHHRCLSGMGTPDMLGTYGTYQYFAENGPLRPKDEGGGRRSMIFFENETSIPQLELIGPPESFLKENRPTSVLFTVHRDTASKAAVIEIQQHKLLLKEGEWSEWLQLDFEMSTPSFVPTKAVTSICRFYLQEVTPNFRLYVTPINIDPSNPAVRISESSSFIKDISRDLGLFYTTGFQEDHKALSNGIFTEEEFVTQAGMVLEERLNLLDYALRHYDDGLLFFYFSSTDMQAHMLWWDSDQPHPTRNSTKAQRYFNHLQQVYERIDNVIGDIIGRYGNDATIFVLSDHGFANFRRQFDLNLWLRQNGYLYPADAHSILEDVDWQRTRAYGLGINGLYLNLAGREANGIVHPDTEKESLLTELTGKLAAVKDRDGQSVIRAIHRTDKIYQGPATTLSPDLVIGYAREYRASWATCLGGIGTEILSDNDSDWCADHCADRTEVPGVLFCNQPVAVDSPSLEDLAPTILQEFGLGKGPAMTGNSLLST